MLIKVTQQDIKKGIPFIADKCPIALALCRYFDLEFIVGPHNISFRKKDEVICYDTPLPEKAYKFLNQYDTYFDAEPFEFEIEDLNEYLK